MKVKLNLNTPISKPVKQFVKNNTQFVKLDKKIARMTTTAREELEMNAERLSPQEYISARNYISKIELSELFKSEF